LPAGRVEDRRNRAPHRRVVAGRIGSGAMKILSLDVENIKRIAAVHIEPATGQPIVPVTGKNGAGKSSVMDAIAMALGGKRLCPSEPLRRGQNTGHVSINLGPYIITRRFWRRETFDCTLDHQHTADCPTFYGDVDSSLTVKSPDGADYKSPQALLDKLVSDLTFDPLGFLELQPKDQRELVRSFTGLDFTMLDTQRKTALARLNEAETELKLAQRDVDAGEHYPLAPEKPIDVADLLQQLANAEALEKTAATAEAAVDTERRRFEMYSKYITEGEKKVKELEEALAFAKRSLETDRQALAESRETGKKLRAQADAARAAVPDTTALRERVAQANDINAQVAANERYAAILTAKQDALNNLAAAKTQITAIDIRKIDALSKATFPVDGLSFNDDGLVFDGLPFEQASYAQQLRVAVAMGLALNPKLKILLIKHGNALDVASLQLLASLAEEHGAQVWIERVAESADGVSVYIEEGRLASTPAAAAVPEEVF
jgi:hypothetical protein